MEEAGNTSEGPGPPRKKARVRVTRACEECRKRKERCDGGQPRCERCVKVGRSCSYHQSRKRGLRTGYVRGLEILLGLLLHSFEGSEELVLSTLQRHDDESEQGPGDGQTSAPQVPSLLELWRSSRVSGELQKALMASEEDEDEEESYLCNLDVKLTSNFNAFPRLQSLPTQPTTESIPAAQPHPPIDPNIQATNYSTITFEPQILASAVPEKPPSSTQVPRRWSHLLDTYIGSTHCWLPVVEKYTLFRSASLARGSSNMQGDSGPTPGESASLWAALAYGSYFAELVGNDSGLHDNDPSPSQIYAESKRVVYQDLPHYEHGHVHALLVLCVLDISKRQWNSAWLGVSRAISIASTLNIPPFEGGDPQLCHQSEVNKKLFRGCFILETLLATRLGCRPQLHHTDLVTMGAVAVEGLEEWETWRPTLPLNRRVPSSAAPGRILSTFNDLGRLMGLLSLSNRLRARTSSRQDHIELLQTFNQLACQMPMLGLTSDRQTFSLADGSPHGTQLKLAAAAVYMLLCHRTRAYADSQTGDIPAPQSAGVIDTIKAVNGSRTLPEPFDSRDSAPTAQILLYLLDQTRTSTPVQALAPTWDSAVDTSSLMHNEPPGDVGSFPLINTNNQSAEMNPSSGTSHVDDPHLAPQSTALEGQGTSQMGSASGPADSGLFGQLSILDTPDWPLVSEDFMEHLGFSRDGNVLDFQSLISS